MSKRQENELRSGIVAACRQMNASGLDQGTSGNISARFGDEMLITPSGMACDDMSPTDIVRMDLEGGYFGDLLPSSEWRMHLGIMRNRPEAGAVVHVHASFCTALACLNEDIPAFHYMVAVAGGPDIRCAEYATFGTQALSDNMLKALEGRVACLLANHGMICFGPSLGKAMWLATAVEALAKQYCTARQTGRPVLLDNAEMSEVLSRFSSYGKQADELSANDLGAILAPVRRDLPMVRTAVKKRKTDPRRPRAKASVRKPRRPR